MSSNAVLASVESLWAYTVVTRPWPVRPEDDSRIRSHKRCITCYPKNGTRSCQLPNQ